MRKLLILIIAVLVIVFGYNYLYKDHRDIKTEQAEFLLSTNELSSAFSLDAIVSEKKYLNKTIEVSGTVTEISEDGLTLDDKIYCQFDDFLVIKPKLNALLKIKGRVIGYDDLLEQVKLDQCYILN